MSGDGEQPRTVDVWRSSISVVRPCRGCGASIIFAQRVTSPAGKLTPFRAPLTILKQRGEAIEIVDSNHFADCPVAKRFRKVKA